MLRLLKQPSFKESKTLAGKEPLLGAGKKADTKLGKEEVRTCAEPLSPERWEKTLPLELEPRALESSNQAGVGVAGGGRNRQIRKRRQVVMQPASGKRPAEWTGCTRSQISRAAGPDSRGTERTC